MVLYGRDVTIDDIVANSKRFPMMAERQVVIVKEAQELSRTIEKLADYAENPQPSTVLVVCYKYKKIDKRKKLYKVISKNGVIYEGKKQITADHIEENIGISKEFNNFELRKAVGARNVTKAHRIINYFSQNPKDNPLVVTIALLYSFFIQVLKYHGLSDKSQRNVASVLKVNPYFVKDYTEAAHNYPMKRVSYIIGLLRDADVKSKGVGAANLPQGDILKELLVKVMG